MIYDISQICGFVGVFLTLSTYLLVQIGKLSATQLIYPLANLIGSVLLLFSLFYAWNLPSVIIEVSWGLISVLGIYTSWRKYSNHN